MKFLIALSLVLFAAGFSHATEVKKIFDGTQAYCPEPTDAKYFNQDLIIRTHVENNQLVIQASTCVDGKWQNVSDLKNRTFTTFDKITVVEKYYDFVLFAQTSDWGKALSFPLTNFEDTAVAKISLDELKKADASVVDVNLVSTRFTKASNGYSDTDDVRWGSTRLFFKK